MQAAVSIYRLDRLLLLCAALTGLGATAQTQRVETDGGAEETGDAGTVTEADGGTVEAAPAEPPPPERSTTVHGAAAPRSASAVTIERPVMEAAPHHSADELLLLVPGMFVAQHGGEGSAYQMFYRGFDAVHGQDVEISVGGAPVNDVSNVHGQGYADLHFLPPEVVRSVVATPGTYDVHQGDFAVAGSLRFDLDYAEPGATVKVEGGSFQTWRLFLGFHPSDADPDTFAAAELYQTTGFGPSRAAQRASAVGQTSFSLGALGTLRVLASGYATHYATAGVLRLADIESGAVGRYDTYDPSQGGSGSRTQLVAELRRNGTETSGNLTAFAVYRTMMLRENFTGYLTSPDGDAQQQLNDDLVLGFNGEYRVKVPLFSSRDRVAIGISSRTDIIDQSQRQVASVDNHVIATPVNAKVRGYDIGAFLDLALHPLWFATVRGGLRVDGLGYFAQDDGAKANGQARSSQGFHLGPKATVELHTTSFLDVLLSYGEGFRSPQARSLQEGETTPFTSVHSVEAGVRLSTEKVRGSLAGFYTRLSDDLVFDQATVRNERVPATQRIGGTAEAVFAPLQWALASASVTYSRASFVEGNTMYDVGALVPYAPQWVVRVDAAASPEVGTLRGKPVKLTAGVGFSALLVRPLPFGQFGSDIALLDARLAARWWHFEAGVECWNLLDTAWYEGDFIYASKWDQNGAASLVPLEHVTVGAPRAFRFTFTLFI
ncbi:MAG: TonB-dependent receptor [Myxococcaceae bacterium]